MENILENSSYIKMYLSDDDKKYYMEVTTKNNDFFHKSNKSLKRLLAAVDKFMWGCAK
jgi:hypothetical protein